VANKGYNFLLQFLKIGIKNSLLVLFQFCRIGINYFSIILLQSFEIGIKKSPQYIATELQYFYKNNHFCPNLAICGNYYPQLMNKYLIIIKFTAE